MGGTRLEVIWYFTKYALQFYKTRGSTAIVQKSITMELEQPSFRKNAPMISFTPFEKDKSLTKTQEAFPRNVF